MSKIFHNSSGQSEIVVRPGLCKIIKLQDLEPGSREFQLKVILQGDGANCQVIGRARTTNQDRKRWCIQLFFTGSNQIASLDMRGVAEDKSHLLFDGGGYIQPGSTQAETSITEKIILWDQARGNLLPILRVETDAVRAASHSASIAPIESEQLLYAQSRGLPLKDIRQMIIAGFLHLP